MLKKIAEKLVELGHDAGITLIQDTIKDALYRKQCVDAVSSYLDKQKKYNGLTSIAEEYDFEGLCDYFKDNLTDKVWIAISGSESERRVARRDLYNAAYHYAGAKTNESRQAVHKLISDSVEILRFIAKGKISFENKLLAAEIEDTVNEHTSSTVMNAVTELKASIDQSTQFSMNRLFDLKAKGSSKEIEIMSQMFNNAVASTHQFFPYYKAVPSEKYNGKLISVPATNEALTIMPPKFVCKGTVKMGNKVLTTLTQEDIDYADRHQIPITLTVIEAKKFLGDFEDPYQHEAEGIEGTKLVRSPKEFEPAPPYSIKIDGETLYEYIELGLVEILDNGSLVINNEKQEECIIKVNLILDIKTHRVDVRVNIEDKSNVNYLRFVKLMKAAMDGRDISFFSLKLNTDFIRGGFNNCDYISGFDNLDEEIDFLERVCEMEEYFGRTVSIPEEILEKEYNTVCYISEMIRGGIVERAGNRFKSHGIVDSDFKQRILEMDDKTSDYAFVGGGSVEFWGDTFEFPLLRTIKNAHINKLENVKKMVELLEDGDEIPITIVSEDACYYDQFAPDELVEQSSQILEKSRNDVL